MDSIVHNHSAALPVWSQKPGFCSLFVDAGVRNLRLRACGSDGSVLYDTVVPSNSDLHELFSAYRVGENFGSKEDAHIFITGKLGGTVRDTLGCGKVVLPTALFWLAARDLIALPENSAVTSLAMLDLSASGYLLVGIDRTGELKDDLLLLNPRCGAGSGINLDRVLQKLALTRGDVDPLLSNFLGEAGRERREKVSVRADRCGVFASSATISDKNQGIPLDVALATTLKSEVLKACKKLPKGFDKVYLTGRIFRWLYARDCAEDLLRAEGVQEIAYDTENTQVLESLRGLVERIGADDLAQPDQRLIPQSTPEEYPSFTELKSGYEASGHYLRLADEPLQPYTADRLAQQPVILGLDVGSTMAKAVVADAMTGDSLFQEAYSNAGDTIETIKQVFRDLHNSGAKQLAIRSIGITGSARYQVQQALLRIYPVLGDRISVLVENYAHARGSIDHARRHIRRLKEQGFTDVNEEFCILIDIGGEDTKISTIALEQAELFDNAMNLKCSAGTGSLMDTLSAMFDIGSIAEACAQAYAAPRSFAINATCAVFLMENASKLQAQGVPKGQILASANWAIVENMARTLWNQLELPGNAVVLLHGQTMLSEPLPLAVTNRLQSYLGRPVYALVPPRPGHRACIGLIRTLLQASPPGFASIRLGYFIDTRFEKHIILCKGAACGDPSARCNRCSLSCRGMDGAKISFTLGGCTAINELLGRKGKDKAKIKQPRDAYKEIWDFIDSRHPRSEDPKRLVIPRSFAVSEWAYFLSRIFERLGIPVHVDRVREKDLTDAQPDFNIDSCAPQMGAVGQFRRLAAEPHGMILALQIETLPTGGKSRGLACTTNQGGVVVAKNLAEMACPTAQFHLIHLNLDRLDAGFLCDQLHCRLETLFRFYGVAPSAAALQKIIEQALEDHRQLQREAADLAADLAEEALAEGRQVVLVVGREYILNPGIYDSHIRRLLRDKKMTAIPSYVLDMDLDE
jgi:activator of 2-hydroxyglutaryl-CoA dehydratase